MSVASFGRGSQSRLTAPDTTQVSGLVTADLRFWLWPGPASIR